MKQVFNEMMEKGKICVVLMCHTRKVKENYGLIPPILFILIIPISSI